MVLTIIEGAVHERCELSREDFEKFRRSQYESFRKTPEYAKARAEAKRGYDPTSELIEQFLFQYASGEYLSRISERSSP